MRIVAWVFIALLANVASSRGDDLERPVRAGTQLQIGRASAAVVVAGGDVLLVGGDSLEGKLASAERWRLTAKRSFTEVAPLALRGARRMSTLRFEFNQLILERFGAPNEGSAKLNTMLRAINTR